MSIKTLYYGRLDARSTSPTVVKSCPYLATHLCGYVCVCECMFERVGLASLMHASKCKCEARRGARRERVRKSWFYAALGLVDAVGLFMHFCDAILTAFFPLTEAIRDF